MATTTFAHRRLASILAVACLTFVGVVATTSAFVPPPGPSLQSGETTANGISVKINCSAGQIDQRHRVTVTVSKENPDGSTTTITVTQNVPSQSHVNDVAVGIATKLSLASGETISATGDGLERKIDLPEGWKVEDVKTEKKVGKKWRERDGHLKVRSYSSTSANGIVPLPASFDEIVLVISESDAHPLAVHLTVKGSRPNGTTRTLNYEPTYAEGTLIGAVMQDLGDFLSTTFGMTVEYPDERTLRAYPNLSVATVPYVAFGAYEDNDHDDITDPNTDTPPWTVVTSLTTDP